MKKQHKQMNPLRPLGKPVYIFIFPFLFVFLFFAFAEYWKQYYGEPLSEWAYLLLIPLALLGMAIGYQLEIYLKEHLGKKAEMVFEILLATALIGGIFAQYQYVIVPEFGCPPISLHLIWDVLRRCLPFSRT